MDATCLTHNYNGQWLPPEIVDTKVATGDDKKFVGGKKSNYTDGTGRIGRFGQIENASFSNPDSVRPYLAKQILQ